MIVATAASMDDYTAFGAAITRASFKQIFARPAPRVVLAMQSEPPFSHLWEMEGPAHDGTPWRSIIDLEG